MAAGTLRHRIVLQSQTRATNSDGQVAAATWSTQATVSAHVEIKGAGESIDHRQKRGFILASAEIRYTPTLAAAIKTDWRFTFNGMTFAITAANDVDGNRQRILIDAEAKPGLS